MSDDLLSWFAEEKGFSQGTKAPHKWVLQAEQELRTLRAQLDSTLKDRALIIAERDRTFALMLARAEAAEARADAAVKVKPLVWENDNWTFRVRAKASIGDYVIWWGYNGEKHSLRFDDRAVTEHHTLEAAKAAAQADHDARIRAAIGGAA